MIHDVEELPKSRTPQLAHLTDYRTASSGADGGSVGNPSSSSVGGWQMGAASLGGIHDEDEDEENGNGDFYPASATISSSVSSPPPSSSGNPSRTRLGETRGGTGASSTTNTTGGGHSQDDDTASVNSFKTAPSEPNLSGFVPRQVSDSYETRVLGPAGAPGGNMQVRVEIPKAGPFHFFFTVFRYLEGKL